MRKSTWAVRTIAMVSVLALVGCGDNKKRPATDDGGTTPQYDAGPPTPGSALDRPIAPRPPSPGLPAELRPPR